MATKTRSILLVMHHWSGYLHGVQLGISEYIVQRPEWVWTRLLPIPESLERLPTLKVDGVIAFVEPAYLPQLQALGAPVVDVANWQEDSPFARVLSDDRAVGRMAARHLMDIGLKHFGVMGPPAAFSDIRKKEFCAELAKEGLTAEIFGATRIPVPEGVTVPQGISAELAAWLLHLPKPVGIFGTFDAIAADVVEACRE